MSAVKNTATDSDVSLKVCFQAELQTEIGIDDLLDQRPPAVLQVQLQLLQDAAALLQLRRRPVGERHVVNGEAPLLVGVQQRGNPVPVQLAAGAEDKDLLHTLVQELLCSSRRPTAQHGGAEEGTGSLRRETRRGCLLFFGRNVQELENNERHTRKKFLCESTFKLGRRSRLTDVSLQTPLGVFVSAAWGTSRRGVSMFSVQLSRESNCSTCRSVFTRQGADPQKL